ncbi:hypothetical protein PMAYCL1PPCAC_20419, partial [Pristionchus mayeri]
EAPLSYVRYVVKDVLNELKTFKIDNLKEIKKRAKANIIIAEQKRQPRFGAVERAIQIFAGVKENAVLNAIDKATESQLEAAV